MVDISFTYLDFEYFLLVLMRVLGFIYAAPFFSMSNVPRRVRVALGVFSAILIFPHLDTSASLGYETVMGYAVLVIKETVTGILIGFGASICNSVITFAGQIMDMEIGLSMVNLMDPMTNQNASFSGVFYQYAITLMMIISGMYYYIFQALLDTFTLIPITGAVFRSDKLLAAVIEFLSDYVIIGFRICLPVFIVMVMLNAVLGILAKVAPQMNMFAVGIQIKVLTGLGVLFLMTALMPSVANFIFMQMKVMITSFVEAML